MILDIVRELEPLTGEKLDPVVLVWIVRGRNHDPRIGAEAPGQKRDGGRRHGADQQDVHAHGTDPRRQRRLDEVPGKPGILSDDDAMAARAGLEDMGGRPPQLQGGLAGHGLDVRHAPDAVSPE